MKLKKYIKQNQLMIYFVLSSLINSTLVRLSMLDNSINLIPFLIDLGIVTIIASFSYFMKEKNKFRYFLGWSIFFVATCIVNAHYYGYYDSFVSVSLLATSTFITDVSDVVIEDVLHIEYFVYLWQIIGLIFLNKLIKNKKTNEIVNTKILFKKTILTSLVILIIPCIFITNSQWNRLRNLWNRETVVRTFGIYVYQFDDLFQSLKPQLNNLFGHDNAYKKVSSYYETRKSEKQENEYTNIFEGKNVIVIHAESIQSIALNKSFNGVEVTPTLNKLIKESIYFSNFYSQVGVGTSSDAEFTFATSLMPSTNGTVFVNYFDREYVTIQKLMKEKGYYVASMHANNGDFWNRQQMHKNMGYDKFYDKDYYEIDETIGLGLTDKSFFRQSIPYIKEIDENYDNYYITLLMLSNHTPFSDENIKKEIDTTQTYIVDGNEIEANPIEGTMLENYFNSVHYADEALGEFIASLDKEGLLEDTVLIIYGDHDARIDKDDYDLFYNYNPLTNSLYEEDDPNYIEYNKYDYFLDKKVPFIIWTKDNKYVTEVTTPTGMIDVLPTIGNMLNVYSDYQLGHDIFSIKNNDNVIVFTDGSYITKDIYYVAQKNMIYPISGEAVDEKIVKENSEMADQIIDISNDIINYNLIKEIREKKSKKS